MSDPNTVHVVGNVQAQTAGPIPWAGGKLRLRLSGSFLFGGGVGTSVALHHVAHLPDGSPCGTRVHTPPRVFSAAGEGTMTLGAGEITLHFAGPDNLPWSVVAELEGFSVVKSPTRLDRIEQRLDGVETVTAAIAKSDAPRDEGAAA